MAQDYDKIFRENFESFIDMLFNKVTGLEIIEKKMLASKSETTIEREPDFVYRVIDNKKNEFILHIEIQVTNDSEMLYRMGEYFGLLFRKTKLPVYQYVFYIGSNELKMQNSIRINDWVYKYNLLDLRELYYEDFIGSNVGEVLILAILTNFRNVDSKEIVRKILLRLKELHAEKKNFAIEKYIIQLRVLSKLRQLNTVIKEETDNMSLAALIDYAKDDPFYLEGLEKGILEGEMKGKLDVVLTMLNKKADIELISIYTGLSIDQIEEIKHSIN